MEKLHYSIKINAPKQKVWETLIGEKTYLEWTAPFSPNPSVSGSKVEGDWSLGSKMLFLAQDEQGKMGGMVSRIAQNKPYEYLSIEHLGIVNDGVEDTTSPEAKKWAPAFENYTLNEIDGVTEFTVDQDMQEEYVDMFNQMWPKALAKLKEVSER